ncbi:MAG: SIMPL domain-containing protein, partial [Pseudomonadota bacterium]
MSHDAMPTAAFLSSTNGKASGLRRLVHASHSLAAHLFIMTLALALPLSGPPAMADDNRRITLSATQTIEETPDYATFSTGVVSRAETAKDALAANAKAMRNVVDGLTAMGVAGKDVQTSQFNVSPLYTQQKNGPSRIDGFEVRNQLSVRIRDLADIGPTIDTAAGLGANQFGSLDFGVSNT